MRINARRQPLVFAAALAAMLGVSDRPQRFIREDRTRRSRKGSRWHPGLKTWVKVRQSKL